MKFSKRQWLSCILCASLMAIFAIAVLFAWNSVDVMRKADPDNYISIHDFPDDLSYYVVEQSQSIPGIFGANNRDDNSEYLISFLTRVNRNASAMIRYFHVTDEGDLIICDVAYEAGTGKFEFYYDCSRDAYSSKEFEAFSGELLVIKSFGKTSIGASVQNEAGETGYGCFSAAVNEEDFDRIKKLFAKLEKKGLGEWIVEME